MSFPNTTPSLTARMLEAIERDLRQAVALLDAQHCSAMSEMIGFHFGWLEPGGSGSGKRIRPLLTTLACAAVGGDWPRSLPAASSVELIHNFSLVHDDIQDNSLERRGRPTLWARWGIPQALNTGDAMWSLAHLSLYRLRDRGTAPEIILSVQQALDQACLHLTEGQHLDLAYETRPTVSVAEYMRMIEGKTAALISAAVRSGALIAGASADASSAFARFGRHLGLAFQILDDILGIWGTTSRTGKPAGDDLRARKKTLPILHGLEHSDEFRSLWNRKPPAANDIRAMAHALETAGSLDFARAAAEEHTTLALAALDDVRLEGEAGEDLSRLAQRLLQRDR